jgi:hypothetical protein
MVGVSLSELGLVLRGAGAAARGVLRLARPGRRAAGVAIAGVGLASCSSISMPSMSMPSWSMPGFDSFKPKPTTTLLLIESNPGGAQAKTSFGKTCTTPCTMQVGEGNDFTVTFTLDGYMPQTLTVHSTMSAGDFTTGPSPVLNPGSLFPTLERAKPPAVARKPSKPHA